MSHFDLLRPCRGYHLGSVAFGWGPVKGWYLVRWDWTSSIITTHSIYSIHHHNHHNHSRTYKPTHANDYHYPHSLCRYFMKLARFLPDSIWIENTGCGTQSLDKLFLIHTLILFEFANLFFPAWTWANSESAESYARAVCCWITHVLGLEDHWDI